MISVNLAVGLSHKLLRDRGSAARLSSGICETPTQLRRVRAAIRARQPCQALWLPLGRVGREVVHEVALGLVACVGDRYGPGGRADRYTEIVEQVTLAGGGVAED